MAYRRLLIISASVAIVSALGIAQGEAAGAAPASKASKECSAQADAKFLTGKTRKKFRSECLRNARKAARSKS
jgi:hypothetical protein